MGSLKVNSPLPSVPIRQTLQYPGNLLRNNFFTNIEISGSVAPSKLCEKQKCVLIVKAAENFINFPPLNSQ